MKNSIFASFLWKQQSPSYYGRKYYHIFPWLVCYLIKLIRPMADSPDGCKRTRSKRIKGAGTGLGCAQLWSLEPQTPLPLQTWQNNISGFLVSQLNNTHSIV